MVVVVFHNCSCSSRGCSSHGHCCSRLLLFLVPGLFTNVDYPLFLLATLLVIISHNSLSFSSYIVY